MTSQRRLRLNSRALFGGKKRQSRLCAGIFSVINYYNFHFEDAKKLIPSGRI